MRESRQDYRDASFSDAKAAACDTFQLKLDGWWSRTEILNGQGRIFSETGRHLQKFDFQLSTPICATIIGELMYGTQWAKNPARYGKIYLFDIWQLDGQDLEAFSYRDRYAVLRILLPQLGDKFDLVQNYKLADRDTIWNSLISSQQFEGLVYRNSRASAGQPLLREKYTLTEDLQVVGFREGQGKHGGRLGALLCITADGTPCDVGGGLDDAMREEVWRQQDNYLRRWCQVEAKKRFESGSLRHPNFIAWRPEGWQP